MRTVVVLGTLGGFLGTVAPGSATALHVVLEHENPLRASEHAHPSGSGPASGEAHRHQSDLEVAGHRHHDGSQVHRQDAPGHRHALSLEAGLLPRASRPLAELSSAGPATTPRVVTDPVDRSPLLARQRAGPPLATTSLSRRSVVLQV